MSGYHSIWETNELLSPSIFGDAGRTFVDVFLGSLWNFPGSTRSICAFRTSMTTVRVRANFKHVRASRQLNKILFVQTFKVASPGAEDFPWIFDEICLGRR